MQAYLLAGEITYDILAMAASASTKVGNMPIGFFSTSEAMCSVGMIWRAE